MTKQALPERVDQITAEWLTSALRQGGVIDDAVVSSVRSTVIGDGIGFMGVLARVEVQYDPPQPDAPASMVAKLPTEEKKNRGLGELYGVYEKELRFYRDLAPRVPIRTPRLYFAAMEEGPTPEETARARAMTERLPYWLLAVLGAVMGWIAGRFMKRRNVILMEDLSGMRPLDQLQGCNVELAESVARSIAKAHASHWGRTDQRALHWVPAHKDFKRITTMGYRTGVGKLRRVLGDVLSDKQRRLLAWLDDNFMAVTEVACQRPATLCHGDFRLPNMFHSQQEGVVTLDWQGTFLGSGLYDLAYFMSGSLIDATRDDVEQVLRAYHDGLVEGGVSDYGFDALRSDYDRSLAIVMGTLVSLVNGLEYEADPELQKLAASWVKRHGELLELADTEHLLQQAA